MGTHPSFSSTGPSATYQPKTTDYSDNSVAGTVYPGIDINGAAVPSRITAPSFNRTANTTAYALGQAVTTPTTATPLVFPVTVISGRAVTILRAFIKKSGFGNSGAGSVANALFRLHLFGTAPSPTSADGVTFATADAGYMGAIDIAVAQNFTDSSYGFGAANNGAVIVGVPSAVSLYGMLEARASYQGASAETFTVGLELQ